VDKKVHCFALAIFAHDTNKNRKMHGIKGNSKTVCNFAFKLGRPTRVEGQIKWTSIKIKYLNVAFLLLWRSQKISQ